jgi:hypothetical protein
VRRLIVLPVDTPSRRLLADPVSAASYRWRRHNGTIGLDSLDIRKLTLPIFAGGRLRNVLEPRKSQKCRQWSMRS